MIPIPNLGYTRLWVHQLMLADEIRTHAFQRAIASMVKPGDTVVDLGTGSGIMAFFACAAHARKVYAIEREQIIEVARRVAAKNGLSDRIVFIHACSEETDLPEMADVLISECIGSFGVNTTMIRSYIAARDTFLKPNGVMIPNRLTLYLAPIESLLHDWILRFWERAIYGLDYTPAFPFAANQMYTVVGGSSDCLAEPAKIYEIDFRRVSEYLGFRSHAVYSARRNGLLHGFYGWFEAVLSPDVVLGTSPADPPTHWYQVFLPVTEVVQINKGDAILVEIGQSQENQLMVWNWSVEVRSGSGDRQYLQHHNSRLSFPLDPTLPLARPPAVRRSLGGRK